MHCKTGCEEIVQNEDVVGSEDVVPKGGESGEEI